jgi:cytochrome oxidase assembly protein ShyY1
MAVLSPRLIPLHLLALVATSAAVWLGVWQYDAWQERRAAEARDLVHATPVPLDTVLGPDAPFPADAVGRPVTVAGRWVPEGSFLVSGRELGGRRGFWAVTPLAVCATDGACPHAPALLVVRGWSASAATAPAPPTGTAEVTGWLQPPEGSGRPDPDPDDDVLVEMRVADAVQRVNQDLYGAYAVAREVAPRSAVAGLDPVSPGSLPEPETFTALRNLLYAFEWWLFAGFAAFVWVRWCRDEADRSRGETKATPREDGPVPPLR